ncbi:unnamed protein product [Linum tenue]|uniref:ENT domain-containing protein n=1 Tax=Linum tenue TaxID=586396 RepID=A0AAV0J1V8_9ROSI|nr:unnamed protein product [Linum tenue]
MEAQIHHLEQEAYSAVLRAFKAQSDALTWEKEGLITELRKELRVSDDEHRELLSRVNGDDVILRIREWRTTGGNEATRFVPPRGLDMVPSPTISGARKRQKISQGGHALPTLSSVKAMQLPSQFATRPRYFTTHNSRSSSGAPVVDEPPEALLGRKARHSLVYDMGTKNETWEWVDLNEISPEDIRWDGEDPAILYRGGQGGGGSRVMRKTISHGGFIPPGSIPVQGYRKFPSRRELLAARNGFAAKVSDDIELLNTETLVKEVEKVFGVSQPDPIELEKAKMMLKEQEQALLDAIARLADASDGESDGEQHFLHGQPMER